MASSIACYFCCLGNISALELGVAAPAFSLKGVDGTEKTANAPNAEKVFTLDALRGKWVVLEWYNGECPFVRKHYDSDNMQKLQKKYAKSDKVAWIVINSSASGKQGHLATVADALAQYKSDRMAADLLLLDADGKTGHAYGAKTTPHLFIIDPKGLVVYQGAIDSINSTRVDDVPKAINYIDQALTTLLANGKLKKGSNQPYGCSVKY